MTKVTENHLYFLGGRIAAINCFKSIFMNHEITYDTVMERHLRPRWPR